MNSVVTICKSIALLAIISCRSNAQENAPSNAEYFIETPLSISVNIMRFSHHPTFGDFSCATRLSYDPLWIINGTSADLVRVTIAGYNRTYVENIPLLRGRANILSFLSIPSSRLTNNSVVVCAAVSNKTSHIVAYSKPAHLIVLESDVTPINTSTIVDSHFTSSTSLWTSSSAGINETGIRSIAHAENTEVIAYLSFAASLVSFLLCSFWTIIFLVIVLLRQKWSKEINANHVLACPNIYWNEDMLENSTKEPYLEESEEIKYSQIP